VPASSAPAVIQVFIFPVVILKAAWETRFSSRDCIMQPAIKLGHALKTHDESASELGVITLWK
jgi:hypothetical protein